MVAAMTAREVLLSALEAMEGMPWGAKERHAGVATALRLHFQHALCHEAAPTAGAPAELEQLYGLLSRASGASIKRPTAAAAYLKALGLGEFCGRFSRLTSRRRAAAHPDADLLPQLEHALGSLGPGATRQAGENFRSSPATPSKHGGKEESGAEAGETTTAASEGGTSDGHGQRGGGHAAAAREADRMAHQLLVTKAANLEARLLEAQDSARRTLDEALATHLLEKTELTNQLTHALGERDEAQTQLLAKKGEVLKLRSYAFELDEEFRTRLEKASVAWLSLFPGFRNEGFAVSCEDLELKEAHELLDLLLPLADHAQKILGSLRTGAGSAFAGKPARATRRRA